MFRPQLEALTPLSYSHYWPGRNLEPIRPNLAYSATYLTTSTLVLKVVAADTIAPRARWNRRAHSNNSKTYTLNRIASCFIRHSSEYSKSTWNESLAGNDVLLTKSRRKSRTLEFPLRIPNLLELNAWRWSQSALTPWCVIAIKLASLRRRTCESVPAPAE